MNICHQRLNARVQSSRFRTNQNAANWKLAVKEHEQMPAALEAGDATALRAGEIHPLAAQARNQPDSNGN
jgi:hypothetical protein